MGLSATRSLDVQMSGFSPFLTSLGTSLAGRLGIAVRRKVKGGKALPVEAQAPRSEAERMMAPRRPWTPTRVRRKRRSFIAVSIAPREACRRERSFVGRSRGGERLLRRTSERTETQGVAVWPLKQIESSAQVVFLTHSAASATTSLWSVMSLSKWRTQASREIDLP